LATRHNPVWVGGDA